MTTFDTDPTSELTIIPSPAYGAPPGPGALVVVSVGTDHHPFDRLVGAADTWAGAHPDVAVVVQRGTSTATVHAESRELIPYDELCQLFEAATVVVTHGGPSTVMDVRAAGRVPIVVPRDPDFGEHVDGHQLRFGWHLANEDIAQVATDIAELPGLLDVAVAHPERFVVGTSGHVAPGIVAFARELDELLGIDTPLDPPGDPDARPAASDPSADHSEGREA
ncbi:MAG: glycosyltransferase [Actinomycetota bacterium]